jgi:hypothetical protein
VLEGQEVVNVTTAINRRGFLQAVGGAAAMALCPVDLIHAAESTRSSSTLPPEWMEPPHEFSQIPFWFWNDDLSEAELLRQIEDFQAHGVHGFLIHPRAGLPKSIGWLSERMIGFMRFAIERAAERDMRVILYDEGMYPGFVERAGRRGESRLSDSRPGVRRSGRGQA